MDLNPLFKSTKFQDLLCILIIFLMGYTSFGFLFTSDPFIYDDHGFHYATHCFNLNKPLFEYYRLIDWNPYWFAGIPELQFYPPGFTLLGILINIIGLKLFSYAVIYQVLLILIIYLPAVTGYILLRRVGFSQLVSLITAIFLLTYTGSSSGILYGVIMGLTNSRLAIGLFPLSLLLTLIILSKEESRWISFVFCLVLTLIFLSHPYHAFLPLLAIIAQIYTWSRSGLIESKFQIRKIVLLIIISIGIVSFWYIPLIFYSNYVSNMQVWTANSKLRDLVYSLSGDFSEKYFLVLYCVTGLSLVYGAYNQKQKAIIAGLLLIPIFSLAFLFILRLVMIGLLKNYSIDVWRLQDDFYFSVILSSGLGLVFLIQNLITKWKKNGLHKRFNISLLLNFILVLCLVLIGLSIITKAFQFKGYEKFGTLRKAKIIFNLDNLWNYLKKDSDGRILFTSSRIIYPNLPSHFNTHVLALTPVYTDRQILGAVNEPFYSTASFFYFGHKSPIVIREEADMLDNESLFGISWKNMQGSILWNFCKRYNATTVVVHSFEKNVIAYMNTNEYFQYQTQIGPFYLYHPNHYESSWISLKSNNSNCKVIEFSKQRIIAQILMSEANDILKLKVGYYPSWKAYINGKRIEINSDEMGLMMIELPQGENYQITLKYQYTIVEIIGWCITLLALIFLILIMLNKKLFINRD